MAFIQAALRSREVILGDPVLPEILDLSQPVVLVLIGMMHHLRDEDGPRRIVATLVDALVPLAAWRPDPASKEDPRSVYAYGGAARKRR